MRDVPPSRTPTVALTLALVAAGAAGCLQSEPPEDPSEQSYIYRADHPETAPHPASYEGGYAELTVEGPQLHVGPDGPVTVLRERPGEPVSFPAQVEIQDAHGTFDPDQGDTVDLNGTTAQVTADEAFAIDGVRSVTTREATARDGALVVRPTAAPEGNTSFQASRRIAVGGNGAVAADVRVALGAGATAQEGRNGTLRLETGTYAITGSPLELAPTGPVRIPGARGTVTVEGATANATLRGEQRPVDDVRWEATSVSGTLRVAQGEATLDMDLDQWWQDDRPQFEARLEAAFEVGGRTATVTVPQGGNATFWTRATETAEVGSAEEVRPRIETPGTPDDALNATFGISWYGSPDPSAMEQFLRAVVFPAKAVQAFFEDPATRDFAPSETAYIPLAIEAPDDAPTGRHTVEGWFHGENAKSERLTVTVTVEQG